MSPSRKRVNNIAPGGARWSITLCYELDDGQIISSVHISQEVAALEILTRHGRPRRLLSLSTPNTIYADLCGRPIMPPINPKLAVIFLEEPQPAESRLSLPGRKLRAELRDEAGF
jgi:hypothetical protein